MRRLGARVAVVGVGVLILRALAPRLHERMMAGCERMFEQMPEDFPPKRMMRGVEETRSNTARVLSLLEEQERATGVPEPGGDSSSEAVGRAT